MRRFRRCVLPDVPPFEVLSAWRRSAAARAALAGDRSAAARRAGARRAVARRGLGLSVWPVVHRWAPQRHEIGGTIPGNGDLNPYGIVVVRHSSGALVQGDVLISNFNDNENLQGTGSTIVELSPGGSQTLFAQLKASELPGSCPGGVGLTTALTILPDNYVVVGSLPSEDGRGHDREGRMPDRARPPRPCGEDDRR